MSENDSDTARRGYHHGNLRAALVEAALSLIKAHGPTGFTFADAARAAGVSPAAPYRHFKDREALLAEVSRQGFARFSEHLERAYESGGPSPLHAFEAVTQAYLDFARRDPAYFVAMFQPGAPDEAEVAAEGERAFSVLRRACEGLVRHLPEDRRPPVHMMSYHLWAMCHGVAELFGSSATPRRAPIEAGELLEAGAAIYLRGLGLLPGEN